MKLTQKRNVWKQPPKWKKWGLLGLQEILPVFLRQIIAEGGAYEWTIYFKNDLEIQNKIDEQAWREYLAFIKAEWDPESGF